MTWAKSRLASGFPCRYWKSWDASKAASTKVAKWLAAMSWSGALENSVRMEGSSAAQEGRSMGSLPKPEKAFQTFAGLWKPKGFKSRLSSALGGGSGLRKRSARGESIWKPQEEVLGSEC